MRAHLGEHGRREKIGLKVSPDEKRLVRRRTRRLGLTIAQLIRRGLELELQAERRHESRSRRAG